MLTLEQLNPGDAIVTQTTHHPKSYMLHNYTGYTVTGNTGNVVTLNNGSYALMPSNKQGTYTIQKLTTNYDKKTHVVASYMRDITSWGVGIIATFAGDTAKAEANSYVKLLNKARKLLEGTSPLQNNPHTIMPHMVEDMVASACEHTQEEVDAVLEVLTFVREEVANLANKEDKLLTKYDTPSTVSSGKLHLLTNEDGEMTSYGFLERSIIELDTRYDTMTLQVGAGNNTTVYLNDHDGNVAGTITLQREHLEHAGSMATSDLYGDYEDSEVCSRCTDPEWQVDVLMFTPTGGKSEPIEEYQVKGSMSFEQAATLRKLNAWQKSELKSLYEVIEGLVGKDNACLSYSVLDVQEGIYSAIYHNRSANRIQHLRNSLQGTLAKAVLDTEHIGKKHYAKVENTLAPLATINKEISAK